MPEHHPAGVWQVDTGPVAVPDLTRRYERPIDAISLGFVTINNIQARAAARPCQRCTVSKFIVSGASDGDLAAEQRRLRDRAAHRAPAPAGDPRAPLLHTLHCAR